MNDFEYRASYKKLGMTQVGAARFFDVGERTSRRWATGELPVPNCVAITFALMIHYNVSPARAYKLGTGEDFEG